ncbi:MAG: hypothetical protein KDC98_11050 [Planctomycetes bacterium]|nr:hypothetical protein [Planctomycetota bacterium]
MAKRNASPAADVEVVDKPGLGIDEGIVLMTFFLLVGAIALVIMANQRYLA